MNTRAASPIEGKPRSWSDGTRASVAGGGSKTLSSSGASTFSFSGLMAYFRKMRCASSQLAFSAGRLVMSCSSRSRSRARSAGGAAVAGRLSRSASFWSAVMAAGVAASSRGGGSHAFEGQRTPTNTGLYPSGGAILFSFATFPTSPAIPCANCSASDALLFHPWTRMNTSVTLFFGSSAATTAFSWFGEVWAPFSSKSTR